ncbi:hypothetical protein F4775DRAFT_554213 [Biscogniauxia sp. FL1348]|nr:hypothetical protein F4775DRAFT_554213 [Biscogniauxia sp. FL1348]
MASPSSSLSSLSPILRLRSLYVREQMSARVFLYRPEEDYVKPQGGPAPKLIIIAPWLGAKDEHIAKYILQYHDIYPSSIVLLVKSRKLGMFATFANLLVRPAVDHLSYAIAKERLSNSPTKPEILVHVFSNGGSITMQTIYSKFRRDTGQAFPLHAAVYDSCPGLYVFHTTYRAFLTGFSSGIRRVIAAPFLAIVLIFMTIWHAWPLKYLTGDNILTITSKVHNDPGLVKQTSRSYIYGKADTMVDWRHVEAHAQTAVQKGFDVRKEVFDQSPHVEHARRDGNRYWKIFAETWEKNNKTT